MRKLSFAVYAVLAACTPMVVQADDYPTKPIRVVTSAPGGGADIVMRLIGQTLQPTLKQPFVIDNRGLLGAEIVFRAPPDGYTYLVDGSSVWISSLLQKTPYDPVRDLAPVMVVVATPNVLVIHPAVAANSVTDLIALVKAKPGAFNFASGGNGGTSHLAGELFKSMTGSSIVHVPYKGTGPAVVALMAGESQMLFAGAATVMPYVKTGKVKALAVGSTKPTALAPGLPTVAAAGLPGFESMLLISMFAPAKTPPAVIDRINKEIARVVAIPEIVAKLTSVGVEPVANSPDEFGAILKADLAKWAKVIREAGIRTN